MKSIIRVISVTALVVLTGCQVEDSIYRTERLSTKTISIKGIREDISSGDDGPATRTVRLANGDVLWVQGDAISLFYDSGTNGGSKFTTTSRDTCRQTIFSGSIMAVSGGIDASFDDACFWGVYPYRDDVSCDGQAVTMTVPSEQVAPSLPTLSPQSAVLRV